MNVCSAMEPEAWKQNTQVCIIIKNIFELNIQVFLTKNNKIENVENMDGMCYRKQQLSQFKVWRKWTCWFGSDGECTFGSFTSDVLLDHLRCRFAGTFVICLSPWSNQLQEKKLFILERFYFKVSILKFKFICTEKVHVSQGLYIWILKIWIQRKTSLHVRANAKMFKVTKVGINCKDFSKEIHVK